MSGQERDLGDKAQDAAREAADSRRVDRVSRAGLAAQVLSWPYGQLLSCLRGRRPGGHGSPAVLARAGVP